MWSILERLLTTERFPRKATTVGAFARPALHEREAPKGGAPFVATNMTGRLLQTRPSREGVVRSGFFEVDLEDENLYLGILFQELWGLSAQQHWPNRCTSIAEAVARMQALDVEPKILVVPLGLLSEVCERDVAAEEAEKLMLAQGYVVETNGIRVLMGQLPANTAILTTTPDLVGTYTRVDDCLSVLLFRADRTMVLVGDAVD